MAPGMKLPSKSTPTVPPPPNFYLGPSSFTLHHVLHERLVFLKKLRSYQDFESSSDRQEQV